MTQTSTLFSDLLAPIPGARPTGTDLRYLPLYDKLRSARRVATTDDAEPGAWRALSDQAAEALRTQSKDLQLAIWLIEGRIRTGDFAVVAPALVLMHGLLSTFWEDLYPAIDSDDDEPLGLRVSAVDWLNARLPELLAQTPLTDRPAAYGLVHYEASQATGEEKKKALLESGWPTSEQFNREMDSATDVFLQNTLAALVEARAALEQLHTLCQTLFKQGDRVETLVSFGNLTQTLDTCHWLVQRTASRRGAPAPSMASAAVPDSHTETIEASPASSLTYAPPAPIGSKPADRDSAMAQIRMAIGFLREDNTLSPLPYLLARALASGQLLAYDSMSSAQPLPAPATATRQRLRTLAAEEAWSDLLEESERAIARDEKQAWLDLYRYSITAMEALGGYDRALVACRAQIQALLEAFPAIAETELDDGTPAAARDTIEWLRSQTVGAATPAPGVVVPVPQPSVQGGVHKAGDDPAAAEWEAANALASSGKVGEAVGLLQSRVEAASSGRERFLRRLQLAELCLLGGNHALAQPILDELARTIDSAQLEHWEDRPVLVRVWTALYRCCKQLSSDDPEMKVRTKEAFARLCRLDPTAAITLERDTPASSRWFKR